MNPSSLDCADCEARLLDLLELRRSGDGEIRRGVDTLLARCPGCRERFEVLEEALAWAAELPMEEPPRQIDAVVMAAARARAGAVTRPSRRGLSGAIEGGFWDRLVQRLGGLAMRPQVTMATLTLLVVTLGVWTLRPSARQARLPEAGEVVVDPDPMGEAVPSYAPAPEELAAADRRGRERPPEPTAKAVEAERDARDLSAAPPADRAEVAADDKEERGGTTLAQGPRRESPGTSRSRRSLQRGLPSDPAEGRLTDLQGSDRAGAGGGAAAASGSFGDDALGGLAGAGAVADEAQAAETPGERPTSAAVRRPPARVQEESLEAAPPNAGAPAAPAAAPTAAPEVPTLAAQLHERARAAARAGRHRTAIGHYRNLLARFPSYLRRGTALVELGDAYRAAGRLADARRAYDRAGRHPEVAARARRSRAALDAPAASNAADEPAAAEAE